MIVGYARVSTDGQDLTSQRRALMEAGCEKVYEEKVSGARMSDRPQLLKLMKAVGRGDIVIVSAIDRLSRDTSDLLTIARDLRAAGASLRSLAEPLIDTGSELGDVLLALLGILASMERGKIKERTARGRADARTKGVKFGRKPKLTSYQCREALNRLARGETQNCVARSFNVSQATISRLVFA